MNHWNKKDWLRPGGILGCGRTHKLEESRTYRLSPDFPLPCCPDCWEGLGFPPDYTDSDDYKADYEDAESTGKEPA